MNGVQEVSLAGGGSALIAVAIAVMARINRKERVMMERRLAAWRAAGSVPEERPNFYSGSGGAT